MDEKLAFWFAAQMLTIANTHKLFRNRYLLTKCYGSIKVELDSKYTSNIFNTTSL